MIQTAIAGFLLVLGIVTGFAQPYLSRDGQFTVSEIRGCDPLTITISVKPDRSDGTCSFFVYRPFGTSAETKEGPQGFGCTATYTYSINQTQTQRLKLQVFTGGVGSNNDDEMEITVDPNIKPEFDIYSCSNSKVQVLIKDKIYDQYTVDFNAPSSNTTTVAAGTSPTATFTYSSSGSKNISVRGKKINGAANCLSLDKIFNAVTNLPEATIQTLTVKDATTLELKYTPVQNVQYRADLALNNSINFQTVSNLYFSNNTSGETQVFTGLKTDENFYCIRLRKFDPCNNNSEVISSPKFICSIKPTLTTLSKVNKISWSPIVNDVAAYTIRRNDDLNFANTTRNLIDDTQAECKVNYCYQVTANYPGNAQSISVEKCAVAFSNETPEAIKDISSVVELPDVNLTWLKPANFDAGLFTIRSAQEKLNFSTLVEIPDTTYTDQEYGLKPNRKYQLTYIDKCDNKSDESKIFRPLSLAGEVNSNNSIQINWNSYQGYFAGVTGYQVSKFDNKDNLLQVFPVLDTFLIDNSPDPNDQVVRYRISAFPVNGNIGISQSNTLELIRQPRLIFPTAFTPDGKGPPENEGFQIFGQYIKTIKLQIFDRWGKLLYTTTDTGIPWNGKRDGEDLPQSSYVWRAEITDLLGREFIRSGSVALIRN